MDTSLILGPMTENLTFQSELYLWGIEVIKLIQKIKSPVLTAFINFITVFGTRNFYLPIILFIFWWVDEKKGLRLGILIIVSAWINSFLKDIFKQPRPFNLDPSLGLAFEPSYGVPSGHAQMSLCFWIPVTVWFAETLAARILTAGAWERKRQISKRLVIWTPVVFIILLIGFTRLYLGLHFPTDLFAGWFLGGIILVIWFFADPFLTKNLASAGVRAQNICAASIALAMNGVYPGDRSFPALFLGFCLGYNIMKHRFPFDAREKINGKRIHICIFRCLAGFAGMIIIYTALRLMLPGEGSLFRDIPLWSDASPFYDLGRFLRYVALGLWTSAGAPLLFRRIGLASGSGEEHRKEEP